MLGDEIFAAEVHDVGWPGDFARVIEKRSRREWAFKRFNKINFFPKKIIFEPNFLMIGKVKLVIKSCHMTTKYLRPKQAPNHSAEVGLLLRTSLSFV